MKTFRITENEIKDMKPVAVGYKIFRNDWTAKSSGYDYKDENGNVLNTIHKVNGNIKECKWGLHFSLKPQDCFIFYESVYWNKFAKVEAYDQVIVCEGKCVTNILKIVEIYTFDEFINLMQKDLQNNETNGLNASNSASETNSIKESYGLYSSNGVCRSYGVCSSNGVNWSNGLNVSYGINMSNGVSWSGGVDRSYGVNDSRGVDASFGVNESSGVHKSDGVNKSFGVYASDGIDRSDGVAESNGVHLSNGVDFSRGVNWSDGVNESCGVSWSNGVNKSYGISECEGISKSIFCYKKSGKLMAFNKRITEERFDEIYETLNSFEWYPKFNNAEQLKGKLGWHETNIPAIVGVDNKTAWSSMPEEMLNYIKSLPEYNEKIFNKITGDEL